MTFNHKNVCETENKESRKKGHENKRSCPNIMNEYNVINNLPFGLDLYNRTRKELKKYSEWFFQNKELRIAELAHAVEQHIGKTWHNDYSVCSFEELNLFLLESITSEPLTEEALAEKRENTPSHIDINPCDLTVKSRSLLVDTGIYWGEVIIKNNSQLHWEQYLPRNKNLVDYGHMVIMRGNHQPINPIWLMYIQGLKIIRKRASQSFLTDLYHIWTGHINGNV